LSTGCVLRIIVGTVPEEAPLVAVWASIRRVIATRSSSNGEKDMMVLFLQPDKEVAVVIVTVSRCRGGISSGQGPPPPPPP
jgi:hypothetical protein